MGPHQESCSGIVQDEGCEGPFEHDPWREGAVVEEPLGGCIGALVSEDDLGSLKHEGRGDEEHAVPREEAVPHSRDCLCDKHGIERCPPTFGLEPFIHICQAHSKPHALLLPDEQRFSPTFVGGLVATNACTIISTIEEKEGSA